MLLVRLCDEKEDVVKAAVSECDINSTEGAAVSGTSEKLQEEAADTDFFKTEQLKWFSRRPSCHSSC